MLLVEKNTQVACWALPCLANRTFVRIALLYGLLLLTPLVHAQSCLPEGITFKTQADVDNFPTLYPGCTRIEGDVQIRDEVLNLDAILGLKAIGGTLTIRNTNALNSLHGLDSLSELAGSLLIHENAALTNLIGLGQLPKSGGNVEVFQNPQLITLEGITALDSVAGRLNITANAQLTTLSALVSVHWLGGDLEISYPGLFENLDGLQNIARFPGSIRIFAPYALTDISALEQLDSVGGNFHLYGNIGLSDLSGLQNLRFVGGNCTLTGFQSLTNLHTLAALQYIGGTLEISSNYSLTGLAGLEQVQHMEGFTLLNCPQVSNFQGLGKIRELNGSLNIQQNGKLKNFSGLDSLRYINGDFHLSGCSEFQSVQGLQRLASVGKWMLFSPAVSDGWAQRFDSLRTVGATLLVSVVSTNVLGFSSLEHVGGDLSIGDNDQLVNLDGFQALRRVDGSVYVSNNNNLQSFYGLENLDTIGQKLYLHNHFSLNNIQALSGLRYVGSTIEISDNHFLGDCAVSILCAFAFRQPDSLILKNNYWAGTCNDAAVIQGACPRIPVVVSVQLDKNGDCLPDVPLSLAPGAIVRLLRNGSTRAIAAADSAGTVFFSYFNVPFALDLSQFPSDNWSVCADSLLIDPGFSLDSIHALFLLKPEQNCPELDVKLDLPPAFRGCLSVSEVTISTLNTGTLPAEGVRTAVIIPPVFEVLQIQPNFSAQNGDTLFFDLGTLEAFSPDNISIRVRTRCDTFLMGQTLCWEAYATMLNACPETGAASSEIRLSAACLGDTSVQFTLENIGDAPTTAPHQYTLYRNEEAQQQVSFSLAAHESTSVSVVADGATWRMEATKYNDGSLTAVAREHCGGLTPGQINAYWLDHGERGRDFDCRQVVGAFDPNLKSAIPAGVGSNHIIPPNVPIRYTIQFQNTGTDTAFRVLLTDWLPTDKLDVGSFRPLASSHPCTWNYTRANGLEVLYEPIALPDSNTNEPASHGYFTFEMKQMPDLPDGDYISNDAQIYFDFNPLIATNTVWHNVGRPIVWTNEAPSMSKPKIQALPNPNTGIFQLLLPLYAPSDSWLALTDIAGRTVLQQKMNAGSATQNIYAESLPAGLYHLQLLHGGKLMAVGRFVKI